MSKALMLIDLQNDYFPAGKMQLDGISDASSSARQLLQRFRDTGRPLVHVKHVFSDPDAPFFIAGTDGTHIHSSVSPTESEEVITKQHVNAFQETNLQTTLSNMAVSELVFCGAMSHMCIEGSVRAASDLGFRCEVVHDACATRSVEFNGNLVSAESVHSTAMASLGFAYAGILSLAAWLDTND